MAVQRMFVKALSLRADASGGLADALLVVLANRWQTRRILTLDERAFRAVKPLQGRSFELLPAHAQ